MTFVLGIGVVVVIFVAWELVKYGLERGAGSLLDRSGRRRPPSVDDACDDNEEDVVPPT